MVYQVAVLLSHVCLAMRRIHLHSLAMCHKIRLLKREFSTSFSVQELSTCRNNIRHPLSLNFGGICIFRSLSQTCYMHKSSMETADFEPYTSHTGSRWESASLDKALYLLDQRDEHLTPNDFILLLQKCRKEKDLSSAKRVYAHILESGFKDHRSLGNHLVPVFVDCGSMSNAQQVFDGMVHRNSHSWTSLISGYAQCGRSQHALKIYQDMQKDLVYTSSYTLVAVIKACGSLKDLRDMHREVIQRGFEEDVFVGSTLVDMYIKHGSVPEAQEVMDKLSTRNIVSWNALIAGYIEQGLDEQALSCFQRMQSELVCPDDITLVCILKACGSIGAIESGRRIHNEIVQKGFEQDLLIGNTLVDVYAKSGLHFEALHVFKRIPIRSVVSWNALIGGYADHGHGQEVLKSLAQMLVEGISHNSVTFMSALKACSTRADMAEGRNIHTEVLKKGLEGDHVLGSSLCDMYAKCGLLSEAKHILEKSSEQSAVPWNALMAGYIEQGLSKQALDCFDEMRSQGVSLNNITLIGVLRACGNLEVLDKGLEMHKQIAMKGVERDPFLGSALVDMYVKCGSLANAQGVFNQLPGRNIVSWTALLAGMADIGHDEEALACFDEMQRQGVSPNATMYACVLKAFNTVASIEKGKELHRRITEKAFEVHPAVGNSLIGMYAKGGFLADAQHVFSKLLVQDVVSWNALIAGYAEHGPLQCVLDYSEKMQLQGVCPNDVTFASAVKVCISIGSVNRGQEIHTEIVRKGFEKDVCLGSSLVDMYAKCGFLAEVQQVFDNLSARNIVSWTVLISGYADHGFGHEALKCYEQMELQHLLPPTAIFTSVLKACGGIGSVQMGHEIQGKITLRGLEDVFLGNALIDMYGKCSCLDDAHKVFEKLPDRDLVSWNSMIMAYGTNHSGSMAMQLFEVMIKEGVKPNGITFVCLLNACSHASMVDKGEELFKAMEENYSIVPQEDHFVCMVDLFARSGQLYEAERFLETMAGSPSQEMWAGLLSACKTHAETELGLRCFKQLVKINPDFAVPYILMENIYVNAGKWGEGHEIEELRRRAGAFKRPGSAIIEVNRQVHEFVVGSNENEELVATLKILTSRLEEHGYVPDVDVALKHIFAATNVFREVKCKDRHFVVNINN